MTSGIVVDKVTLLDDFVFEPVATDTLEITSIDPNAQLTTEIVFDDSVEIALAPSTAFSTSLSGGNITISVDAVSVVSDAGDVFTSVETDAFSF